MSQVDDESDQETRDERAAETIVEETMVEENIDENPEAQPWDLPNVPDALLPQQAVPGEAGPEAQQEDVPASLVLRHDAAPVGRPSPRPSGGARGSGGSRRAASPAAPASPASPAGPDVPLSPAAIKYGNKASKYHKALEVYIPLKRIADELERDCAEAEECHRKLKAKLEDARAEEHASLKTVETIQAKLREMTRRAGRPEEPVSNPK